MVENEEVGNSLKRFIRAYQHPHPHPHPHPLGSPMLGYVQVFFTENRCQGWCFVTRAQSYPNQCDVLYERSPFDLSVFDVIDLAVVQSINGDFGFSADKEEEDEDAIVKFRL